MRDFHPRRISSWIDCAMRLKSRISRQQVVWGLFAVVAVGVGVWSAYSALQTVKADTCDPQLSGICITSITPTVGSTEGGASIGSSQTTDLYGNSYNSPSYNPNAPITVTHSGLSFSRYQPVDYIQFTSATPGNIQTTQYIDTGINYRLDDDSIKMEMDVAYDRITGLEQISGFRSTGSYVWRFFFSLHQSTLFAAAGTHSTPASGGAITIDTATTARRTLAMEHSRLSNSYTVWQNGTFIQTKAMTAPNQDVGSILIGAARDNYGAAYANNYKVYGFKVEKNGVLQLDLEPVWDIITNKFGMVDQNGNFYANSSTGVIAGPNEDSDGNPLLNTMPEFPTVNLTLGGVEVGTCDDVAIVSMTKLSCVPSEWDSAGSGIPAPTVSQAVDVNVTLGSNTSSLEDAYTYRAPMSVSATDPAIGPASGGNSMTINGTNLIPPDAADDYVLVDYIEFDYSQSGTAQAQQFIDTGIRYLTTDNSIKMEMDVAYARITGNEQITGFRITGSYTWRLVVSMHNGTFYAASGTQGTPGGITLGAATTDPIKHAIEHRRTTGSSGVYEAWVDGTSKGTATMGMPNQNVGSIVIGAVNNGSNMAYSANYKVYGFTVEKNGVPVANYVPIQNVSTGEYGLWDTINLVSKWNGGTVALGGGNEIGAISYTESVAINNNQCNITDAVNAEISCDVPAGAIGTWDVVASNGIETITLQNAYTYTPVVTNVSTTQPNGTVSNVGLTTGGNTLTITGKGYSSGVPTVMVGNVACGSVSVANDTTLTCVLPSIPSPGHAPGTVDVIVTVNSLASWPVPTGTADDYIFRSPMSITSITPNFGDGAGGTEVTITGVSLLPPDGSKTGTSVIFDPTGNPAPCTVVSWTDTTIVCTTTTHSYGFVDVKVTNSNETDTLTSGFKYGLLSLSLSSPIATIDLHVLGVDDFDSITYIVGSNFDGYSLTIRADDSNPSTTDDANLKATPACPVSTAIFAPISAPGAIQNNTWAWKTSATTPIPGQTDWKPMTTSDQEIASKGAPSGPNDDGMDPDNWEVHFGAKANHSQPACTYQTTLIATLVAVI